MTPRCRGCGRLLTEPVISMSPGTLDVLGDCVKCGTLVTASHGSWDLDDLFIDLDGNCLGQLQLPIEV